MTGIDARLFGFILISIVISAVLSVTVVIVVSDLFDSSVTFDDCSYPVPEQNRQWCDCQLKCNDTSKKECAPIAGYNCTFNSTKFNEVFYNERITQARGV